MNCRTLAIATLLCTLVLTNSVQCAPPVAHPSPGLAARALHHLQPGTATGNFVLSLCMLSANELVHRYATSNSCRHYGGELYCQAMHENATRIAAPLCAIAQLAAAKLLIDPILGLVGRQANNHLD